MRTNLVKMLCLVALMGLSACNATIPGGTSLRDGASMAPPAGWVDFCRRNANDPSCDARPLDKQAWNELQDAQAKMRAIRYVADKQNFGAAEHWQIASKSGDCEDLALAARQRLLEQGWPASVLRLASVFTETRENHSVLTVEVNNGGRRETLVLDNRHGQVASWDELKDKGYWFLARQSGHGSNWVKIEGGQGKVWKTT